MTEPVDGVATALAAPLAGVLEGREHRADHAPDEHQPCAQREGDQQMHRHRQGDHQVLVEAEIDLVSVVVEEIADTHADEQD